MVFHLFILPLRRFSTVSTTSMSTTSYIEVGLILSKNISVYFIYISYLS